MTSCLSALVAADDPGDDLAVPNRLKARVQRQLERAEVLLVGQVVRDGGMAIWRSQAEERFRVARRTCTRGRIARTEAVALVVALLDLPVRDQCWLLVEEDPDPEWVTLWTHLVRHALPPFRAEPLFLLAWTGWRLGDVPLAARAVEAARVEEPEHRAATMLAGILAGGLASAELPSLANRVRPGRRA